MAAMLPASKSASGKSAQRGLIIQVDTKDSSLLWDDRNKKENLGKFSAEPALEKYNKAVAQDKKLAVNSCSIQLPNKKILRRLITLPSSTEENLENVVSYEMDRYTPFSKEDVYFDIKIQDRNTEEQKITVALSVIKKSIVDDILKFAADAGMSIQTSFAVVDENEGQVEHFAFIKDQQQTNASKPSSVANKFLVILTMILAIVALTLPIAKNYWVAEQYKAELSLMQDDVNQVRRLQSEYKAIKQDVDFINAQTSHSIKTLDLLNELSRIIPDDTFLGRLVLEQGVVRIRGNSAAASKLISIIDASEQFADVRFVAPVTQNSKTGKESFTVEFRLQGEGQNVAVSE